jgi:hypothetical protein
MQTHCQATAVEISECNAIAREQLCGHAVSSATKEHATIENTFPVQSLLELYKDSSYELSQIESCSCEK